MYLIKCNNSWTIETIKIPILFQFFYVSGDTNDFEVYKLSTKCATDDLFEYIVCVTQYLKIIYHIKIERAFFSK